MALFGPKVACNPALIDVSGKPGEAALCAWLIPGKGRQKPARIAIRRLNLDYVRTNVSENPAADKAGRVGKVEDP